MKKTFLLKLLATKKLRIDEGTIQLESTNLNLLPAIFISSLTSHFNLRDELHKLYLISWFWSYDLVGYSSKDLGLEDPEEIYKVGMDLAENMGMGVYKTDDYYPGEYTRFKIETNPYLSHLNLDRFDGPVDVFVSGAMAGGGSHVHDAPCQDVELRCKAQKNEYCEFLTGTEEELKSRDLWETARERYHLDRFIDFQRDVHENYTRSDSRAFVDRLSDLLEEI